MNYKFLTPARAELDDAFAYYETQLKGLGDDFLQEVYRTIQLILRHPLAWTRLSNQTRRCRTRRFPYGVIYQVVENEVIIIAVMHLHRMPGYWKVRLK